MNKLRVSERVPFRRRVKFGFAKPTFLGYTSDLSEGGMRINAAVGVAPNSRIVAEVYIDEYSVVVEGTVVWVSQHSKGLSSTMGMKFSSRADEIKSIYQMKLNEYQDAITPYQGSLFTH